MSEAAPQEACANCRYWASKQSRLAVLKYPDDVGECRRHAPRGPVVLGAYDPKGKTHAWLLSPFPVSPDDDWCGEWAGKATY